MEIPSAELTEDRDRMFVDWAVAILFREVTTTYDPETQETIESYSDTSLNALIGKTKNNLSRGTAGQHLSNELSFTVKPEELPTSSTSAASRIVYNSVQFDVIESSVSNDELVQIFKCRKTS